MISQILHFIGIILLVLLLFNILIIVHELGHFLAARWRGLVVEKFALWFGKPIWKKTINGVEYRLGSIPAGGFVALPQMAPMESVEGESENNLKDLPKVSALDKIIVAFAGPLFSIALAFIFAIIVWIGGRPATESEATTTIGIVKKAGPAEKSGLRAGDKILEIGDKKVNRFAGVGDSIFWRIIRSDGENIHIKAQRNEKIFSVDVKPTYSENRFWERKGFPVIQIVPFSSSIIFDVIEGMPAQASGLQSGDEVLAANGEKVFHFARIGEILRDQGSAPVLLSVKRGEQEPFDVTITPVKRIVNEKEIPMVGIQWKPMGKTVLIHPKPHEQVAEAAMAIFKTVSALFSSNSSVSVQHMSGPIGILNVYMRLFQDENAWLRVFWFSVLVNVNLGLLNLLPIPVLDGGHIVMAIFEGIFGKAINIKFLEIVQTLFAALLIGFMLYISFFDIQDIQNPFTKKTPPAVLKVVPLVTSPH